MSSESVEFQCGCKLEDKLRFGYKRRSDERNNLVCPEHGDRIKNWRSHDDRLRDRRRV